jgi:YbbR domain-containing protein
VKFLKDLLFENWAIKLTAIFLAFFLWLFVRGDRNVERIMTAPLEIRIPRSMEITNERPSFVEVTVRGTPTSFGWGSSGPPAYTIDLQTAGEGSHEVPLSPANVRIPAASGLEVVRVNPPRITLVLERTVEKEVAVTAPPLRGEPADGYDIYRISWWPTKIRLAGPRSKVEALAQLNAAPISVGGLSQSLRTFTNLVLESQSLRAIPAGPVEVNVQVGVHREPRTISGVPVTSDIEGLGISPARITIRILVPVSFKEKLGPEHFSAVIPADSIDASAQEAQVKPEVRLVDSPDPNIVIDRIRPAEVTVRRAGKSSP